MAVSAELFHSDGYLALSLFPGEKRERIEDAPEGPDFDARSPLWFYWDGERLARGEREFLGVVVRDIALLKEDDIAALERLDLPRLDVPEAGLSNATVADVLRWAKRTYPDRPFTRRQAAVS